MESVPRKVVDRALRHAGMVMAGFGKQREKFQAKLLKLFAVREVIPTTQLLETAFTMARIAIDESIHMKNPGHARDEYMMEAGAAIAYIMAATDEGDFRVRFSERWHFS